MKLAIQLRDSLGLSQQQLVDFAGGHRSQLTRAEAGLRSLTADAAINIVKMLQVNATLLPAEAIPQLPVELVDLWKTKAENCRQKLYVLESKLATMKSAYIKACRLLQFAQELKKTPSEEWTSKQVRWIDEQAYQASKIMENSDFTRQKMLAIEIAILQAEAAIYENALVTETESNK
jgi:transcriptional regulator with XRE-family HTH domain